MPRSSRHNNARNNKQKYNSQHQSSPRPSPPTQLPTPLPEEERLASVSSTMHRHDTIPDDQLIDFDTPTPPPLQPLHFPPADSKLDVDHLNLEDENEDALIQTYRSPPFREAHLPDLQPDSPPPLPVLPRRYQQDPYNDGRGRDFESLATSSSGGHTYSRWASPFTTFGSLFFYTSPFQTITCDLLDKCVITEGMHVCSVYLSHTLLTSLFTSCLISKFSFHS